MGYIVRMPKLGMEMKQGILLEWVIDQGEPVSEGDVIAEIESEKNAAEIEAREDGTLVETLIEPGDAVEPGVPIGIVAGPDDDVDALAAEIDGETPAATPSETTKTTDSSAANVTGGPASESDRDDVRASPRAKSRAAELDVDLHAVSGTGPGDAITTDDVENAATVAEEPAAQRISPRAKRRAAELGVDPSSIDGTGPGRAITVDDVESAAADGAAGEGPPSMTVVEERPLSEMRQTIATRLEGSYRNAVHVTLHRKADAEALIRATTAADDTLDADVSLSDLLLKAVSTTLEEHPEFNAHFDGSVHRLVKEQNIGVAIDIEAGLIAPVIPDVAERSLSELSVARRDVTDRALAGNYSMDELENGTFTVSNLGVLGVESFDPVINPPQLSILGVNAVTDLAVLDESGGVAFRRHLPLDLSFDHRVVDGADAARFLDSLVEHIEDPWGLIPNEIGRDDAAEPSDSVESTMPGRSVSATLDAGLRGSVQAGSFEVPFDEPKSVGGSASAPTPVDLLLSSLAACLVESVRYQAVQKRQLDLTDLAVETMAEPSEGPVESISATVTIDVDAPDDTIQRIVDMGKQGCYVSQLIGESVPVSLTWNRS